ncbi:Uncharacterized protein FWK35_00024691, partial [Aphis craccivora]
MLCFFLCVCTRERFEIILQFQTLGVVSDRKMNLVGALGRSYFEFRNSFQKRREKPKKKEIKEKWEFLRKTSFRPNRFFYMVVIQKLITCYQYKIKFSNIVDKKILDDQRFKFLRNLSKTQKFANWRFIYIAIIKAFENLFSFVFLKIHIFKRAILDV